MSSRLLMVGAMFCATASIASAQTFQDVAKSCSAQAVFEDKLPMGDSKIIGLMHPLASRDRYAAPILASQWQAVVDSAAAGSLAALTVAGPDTGNALAQRFSKEMDSVRVAVAALAGAPAAERTKIIQTRVVPVRFRVRMLTNSFVLFAYPAVRLDSSGLSISQLQAVCWSALSMTAVLNRLAEPLRAATLIRLSELSTSWSNYREKGYSRQPLEMFLTPGRRDREEPPATQTIIAHLSIGVDVQGSRLDSLVRQDAMLLEFGKIWYRKDWTSYSGVSAVAAMTTGRAAGVGVMVHFRPGLHGSWVVRRESGKTVNGYIVSTDAYGLLERSKKQIDQAWASVRGGLVLPKS